MATIFAPPKGFEPPEVDYVNYDHVAAMDAEDAYVARLAAEARRCNTGKLVGEVVRFPAADGYAQYMVWKHAPLELVHLALGDAWSIPNAHARGLRITDIKANIERERGLAALFSEHANRPEAKLERVVSAHVTHPNTPESDLKPRVMHTVHWVDEEGAEHETELLAADPLDAMERMRLRAAQAKQLVASEGRD